MNSVALESRLEEPLASRIVRVAASLRLVKRIIWVSVSVTFNTSLLSIKVLAKSRLENKSMRSMEGLQLYLATIFLYNNQK